VPCSHANHRPLPPKVSSFYIGALPSTGLVGSLVQRERRGFIPLSDPISRRRQRPPGWSKSSRSSLLESTPGIFSLLSVSVRHCSVKRVAFRRRLMRGFINFVHQ